MTLEADKRVICSRVNNCRNEQELQSLLIELANINPAAMLGAIKSEKKAESSRENGKKGGRPRKDAG